MGDQHEDQNTAEISAQDGAEFAAAAVNECAEPVGAEGDYAEVNGFRNGEAVETDGTLDDDERIELERASGMSRMESKKSGGYTPPLTREHAYPHPEIIRDIALAYAESGLHVFPCNPSGDRAKQPITKNGFKDATIDRDKIWRWWTQWPSALIGLRTGRTSGVFVVDLDNKNGVNGIAELEKLEEKYGKLPETHTVVTPSGGKHLYFHMPDIDLGCSASRVGPGIDIRAEGGYVIAPPSMLGDGRTYEAVDNGFSTTDPAKAPDWLIKLAMAKRKRRVRTPLDRSVAEIKPRNWVQKILDAECAAVAEAQKLTRNDILNKAAWRCGQLVGQKALTQEEAEDALYDAARECGLLVDTGGEDAVLKTIDSGLTAGREAAFDWPLFPDRHPKTDAALKDSIDNVRALCSFLSVMLKFNGFANRTEIFGLKEYKLLNDNALTEIWALAQQYHFKVSRDLLAVALDAIALENAYHPVRDYFDTLHWDGEERLDQWLTTYAGAEDNEYAGAVGRKTLLAAVRRVRQPGVKHDAMLVLEGPQYAGKSSLFRVLAVKDEWFSDNFTLKFADDERKIIEQTEGCLILEIPELKGMKHSDVETIKAFLSRQSDKGRKAYDRYPSIVPRQFIVGGTINPEEDAPYLKDRTGNRRFWPVEIGAIDLPSLRRDIDQLWAEAVCVETKGESLELPRHVLAAAKVEQEKRVAEDPLVEALDDAFGDMLGMVLTEDVWSLIGKPDPAQRKQWDKTALGQAMRKLGWAKQKLRKKEPGTKESRKRYFYTRGAEPYPEIQVIALRGDNPIVRYVKVEDRPMVEDEKREF